MFLRIEKGSAVPISRQIADQIASLCASGGVQPGERLPSVRELARELAVNQNTVLRVYERLCGEGLLEMRHGQGTFVAGRTSKSRHGRRIARGWSTSCGKSRGRPSGLGFRPTNCTNFWPRRPTASRRAEPAAARSRSRSHERTGD